MSQDDQPGADGPQAGSEDYAGTLRPDAVMPALDEGQLAALREIGREWDQLTADPQVWREALPVDPALGGYPKDSDFRPARFTRVVAVSGRGGQLPALETTGAAETPLTPGARFGRAMRRLTRTGQVLARSRLPSIRHIWRSQARDVTPGGEVQHAGQVTSGFVNR